MEHLKNSIRNVPDFPKKGIQFKDITTLLKDAQKYKEVIEIFFNKFKDYPVDIIIAAEARGFIIGGALAYKLSCGFVPVRKKGKLPWETIEASYDLEYGSDTLYIHKDAINQNQNVLIVDDLLATGGTAKAMCELVEKSNAAVSAVAFIIELNELKGRGKLKNYDVFSLIQY